MSLDYDLVVEVLKTSVGYRYRDINHHSPTFGQIIDIPELAKKEIAEYFDEERPYLVINLNHKERRFHYGQIVARSFNPDNARIVERIRWQYDHIGESPRDRPRYNR